MALGFAFIVTEYCTQSHLSTDNYADAVQGLRRTRWFKKHAYVLMNMPDYVIEVGKRVCHKIFPRHIRCEKRSLVWTWKTRDPVIPVIVTEESRLRGVGEGRNEDDGFLDGGETDGGNIDGEIDATVDVPLRLIQPAPIQHTEIQR